MQVIQCGQQVPCLQHVWHNIPACGSCYSCSIICLPCSDCGLVCSEEAGLVKYGEPLAQNVLAPTMYICT